MRRREGVVRPDVVVVVEEGMAAMTAESTVSGDTPRDACVQPVTATRDAAAIAPTPESERVIMSNAKADPAPLEHRVATSWPAIC